MGVAGTLLLLPLPLVHVHTADLSPSAKRWRSTPCLLPSLCLLPAPACPPQSFLRMKADAAWRALEGKVAGTDVEYKDCTVWPLIATQPAPACPPGADPAQMLPAEVGAGRLKAPVEVGV